MKSKVDWNHGLVAVEVEPKAVHHLAISPRFHKNWAGCCRWKDPASPMQDSFSGQTRLIFAILSHSSSHRCKSSNWRWYHPSSNPTFQSLEFACIKMLGKSEPKQNILPIWWVFIMVINLPWYKSLERSPKTKQIQESEERNLLHVASHIWGEQPPIH